MFCPSAGSHLKAKGLLNNSRPRTIRKLAKRQPLSIPDSVVRVSTENLSLSSSRSSSNENIYLANEHDKVPPLLSRNKRINKLGQCCLSKTQSENDLSQLNDNTRLENKGLRTNIAPLLRRPHNSSTESVGGLHCMDRRLSLEEQYESSSISAAKSMHDLHQNYDQTSPSLYNFTTSLPRSSKVSKSSYHLYRKETFSSKPERFTMAANNRLAALRDKLQHSSKQKNLEKSEISASVEKLPSSSSNKKQYEENNSFTSLQKPLSMNARLSLIREKARNSIQQKNLEQSKFVSAIEKPGALNSKNLQITLKKPVIPEVKNNSWSLCTTLWPPNIYLDSEGYFSLSNEDSYITTNIYSGSLCATKEYSDLSQQSCTLINSSLKNSSSSQRINPSCIAQSESTNFTKPWYVNRNSTDQDKRSASLMLKNADYLNKTQVTGKPLLSNEIITQSDVPRPELQQQFKQHSSIRTNDIHKKNNFGGVDTSSKNMSEIDCLEVTRVVERLKRTKLSSLHYNTCY